MPLLPLPLGRAAPCADTVASEGRGEGPQRPGTKPLTLTLSQRERGQKRSRGGDRCSTLRYRAWGIGLLPRHEACIRAALGEQLGVRALFHYSACVEHHNQISVAYGGESVGNQQGGATGHQAFK